MTDAEVTLRSRLRRESVYGKRFRRQHPIGLYVADFACVPAWLVVEIGGATHSSDSEMVRDAKRDAYLRDRGWRVFRVTNEDVHKNLEGVMEGILRLLPPPPASQAPPP